jgi:hypothetical protein
VCELSNVAAGSLIHPTTWCTSYRCKDYGLHGFSIDVISNYLQWGQPLRFPSSVNCEPLDATVPGDRMGNAHFNFNLKIWMRHGRRTKSATILCRKPAEDFMLKIREFFDCRKSAVWLGLTLVSPVVE